MSERPKECKARQYADQMRCLKCGMVWDTNDPEPPECKREPEPKQTCSANGLLHGALACRHHGGGDNACHYNFACEHQL